MTPKRLIAIRASFLLVALSSLVLVWGQSPASAATAVLKPCAVSGYEPSSLWYTNTLTPSWTAEVGCPSVASFKALPYLPGRSLVAQHFLPQAGAIKGQITAVEFDLTGSNGAESGISQGLKVCKGNTCSSNIAPSGSNVFEPEHHRLTFAAGEIPPNADTLRFEGRCSISSGCVPPRPLEVRNVSIEFEDIDLPTVEPGEEFSLDGKIPIVFGGWNSGVRRISFTAHDATSGPHHADFKVGSANRSIDNGACGIVSEPTIPKLCPPSQQFDWEVDLTKSLSHYGLQQGENPVEITVQDAAGNRSQLLVTSFKADNLRPSITDLRATSVGTHGWQSSTKVDLAWKNLGESVETATQSGLEKVRFDLDPLDSGMPNPAAATLALSSFEELTGVDIPANGRWRLSLTVIDRAGNSSLAREVLFGVDTASPTAPEIDEIETLGAPGLAVGTPLSWHEPSNSSSLKSGICGYAVAVDQQPLSDPGQYPNVSPASTSMLLPSALVTGTHFAHLRAVSCAGVAGAISHLSFGVDAQPPDILLSDADPGGWYSPSKMLSVTATDNGGAVTLRVAKAGVFDDPADSLPLTVALADGVTEVVVEARDDSGNVATIARPLKFDGSPPAASIARPHNATPTVVRTRIVDQSAGVDTAVAQLRPVGGEWRQLDGTFNRLDEAGNQVDLVVRIPDFELANGRYEFRVLTVDRAGNRLELASFEDRQPAVFTLPLRTATTVAAGFRPMVVERRCKGRGKRRKCRNVRVRSKTESVDTSALAYRRTDKIDGLLKGQSGQPLADEKLDVYESVLGRIPARVGFAFTDSNGKFSYTPAPGPSRRVTFKFNGSARELASESSVRLLVRPSVRLKLSRRSVTKRRTVSFSGRILATGATIPQSGLAVDIEFRSGRKWVPFTIDAIAGRDGRFRSVHEFARVKRPIKYRFRARVRWVDGWAYETGYSRTVGLTVR